MAVIIISFPLKKASDNEYRSHVPGESFLNKIYPFPSDTAPQKGAKIDTSEDIQETMSRNPMAFPKEAFQKYLCKESPTRRVSKLRLFSVTSDV